jgi:tRNA pseudouridine38-40 synthase
VPTYRLDLAYDGSGFSGYARQPDVRTVQGVLEDALAPFTGEVESFVAGRTDKGVHALGQVVSFASGAELDAERVTRSLNRRLGPEVSVTSMQTVADDFHARFSATGRRYRYAVRLAAPPDPFSARFHWHYGRPLDVEAMSDAAAAFVGEQDFASLCRRAGDTSTVRLVRSAGWIESGAGLEYRVEASAFCHQMVRSMVAVCVDVGRGKIEVGRVGEILTARDRNAARGAAPPQGLTLMGVEYDDTWSGEW